MKDKRFNNVEMLKENRRCKEYIRDDMDYEQGEYDEAEQEFLKHVLEVAYIDSANPLRIN
jgi:hypothetical protein